MKNLVLKWEQIGDTGILLDLGAPFGVLPTKILAPSSISWNKKKQKYLLRKLSRLPLLRRRSFLNLVS